MNGLQRRRIAVKHTLREGHRGFQRVGHPGIAVDRALRRYVRADLLAIDDFAVLAMDPAQAKLAFQVIAERYDYRRSTLITIDQD